MKKEIPLNEFYHLINHGPVVLITSGTLKKPNIATIAWMTPLNDDPPLVICAIAEEHLTAELIKKEKEFVINIPHFELLSAIKICGSFSGRKIDKFKKANLTPLKSKKVKTPFAKEAIGHIECKIIDKKIYNGVVLFVGRVLHCEIEKNFYDGYLVTEKAETVHHIGGGWFATTGKRYKVKG